MQATVVMLIALSGLGCHHKSCHSVCFPPASCAADVRYAVVYETVVEPSLYNPCRGAGCVSTSCTRAGWGPSTGGYVGCYAGGAIGCGCGMERFPSH